MPNTVSFTASLPTLAAIRVITDPYLPTRTRVRFPKKGPYYRRRLKRTAADPKNYAWPERPFVIVDGNALMCHPDYLPVLKQVLAAQNISVHL